MITIRNRQRASWHWGAVRICQCAIFAALLFGGARSEAQPPPAGSGPGVVALTRGRPFAGDVRALPNNLPPQRERRPDRPEHEDPPLPTAGGPDRVAQTLTLAASAPAPGTGTGAGSFAGLDFANFGDGWPPDTNGDVGPVYYIQVVNTSI